MQENEVRLSNIMEMKIDSLIHPDLSRYFRHESSSLARV